jgi:cytochrome c oxidase subunit 4
MSEHIVPVKVYITIFMVLLVGTGLTVLAAFQDFTYHVGNRTLALNTSIALIIATTKATFVVLYFMHVRYSIRLVWVIVTSALFWLVIMFALTLADYWTRGWFSIGWGGPS